MARMGFLFLVVIGIFVMVFIAKMASKTKSKEKPEDIKSSPYKDSNRDIYLNLKSQKIDRALQKGLISLLLKKNIIKEEELLQELENIKKNEED